MRGTKITKHLTICHFLIYLSIYLICVALEILIQLDQRRIMKQICY